MVRRRRDGNLDFLAATDQMIKLRGFRVEPREIEMALCRHPAVSAAAVVARPHPSGERRLVAYVVTPGPAAGAEPGALPGGEDLRQFIATQLPQYMVPAGFFFVDALPLTDNGKLDRAGSRTRSGGVTPRSPTSPRAPPRRRRSRPSGLRCSGSIGSV